MILKQDRGRALNDISAGLNRIRDSGNFPKGLGTR